MLIPKWEPPKYPKPIGIMYMSTLIKWLYKLLIPRYPNWWQTANASQVFYPLSQTVPHTPLIQISILHSYYAVPSVVQLENDTCGTIW